MSFRLWLVGIRYTDDMRWNYTLLNAIGVFSFVCRVSNLYIAGYTEYNQLYRPDAFNVHFTSRLVLAAHMINKSMGIN